MVVVGGGLSGLETAWWLHRNGVQDVVVLDAGGPKAQASSWLPWRCQRPPHFGGDAERATQIGGRSLRWHGVVLPIEAWALQKPDWPARVSNALLGDGPHGYTATLRRLRHWAGRDVTSPLDEGDAPLCRWLAEHRFPAARPVPRAVKATGEVYTPLSHWDVDAHTKAKTPTLVPDSTVIDVAPRRGGGGATVMVGGPAGKRVLHAGCVVLAAATASNTRLVAQLTGNRGPLLGLTDHLVQGFLVVIRAQRLGLDPVNGFAVVLGAEADRSNLFVRVRRLGADRADLMVDAWGMGEQLPTGPSTVRADGSLPPWQLVVDPGLAAGDEEVLASQREVLHRVWDALGADGAVRGGLVFPDPVLAPVPFAAAERRVLSLPCGESAAYAWPLGTVHHEGGSLPLGGDLVDLYGRVVSVPEVVVTGPATFPRAGAANPSLTTLGLARRTADLVSRGLRPRW